jgi:hypothetical protein
MPMDPMTCWLQASLFWVRLFKQQQDFYLRAMCSVAATLPRESAAEIAAQAEAMKETLNTTSKAARLPAKPRAPRRAAEPTLVDA